MCGISSDNTLVAISTILDTPIERFPSSEPHPDKWPAPYLTHKRQHEASLGPLRHLVQQHPKQANSQAEAQKLNQLVFGSQAATPARPAHSGTPRRISAWIVRQPIRETFWPRFALEIALGGPEGWSGGPTVVPQGR